MVNHLFSYVRNIAPIIVIGLIVFGFQLIPEGFTIAKGDFYWLFNIGDHYSRYGYMWIDQIGQGAFNVLNPAILYYLILGLVDSLGVAYLANWMMFFWLVGAYYSFSYLCYTIYPKLHPNTRLLVSLLYALNLFIITIFGYSRGLNHHFLIYPFIPLLLAGFYQVFFSNQFSLRKIFLFLVYFALSTVAYNNIAWFFLMFLLLLIVLIIGLVQKRFHINKDFWCKMLLIIGGVVAIFTRYLIVFYIGNSDLISKVSSNAVLGSDLSGRIRATSNTFLDSLLLIMGERYPYENVWMMVGQTSALVLVLFVFLFSKKTSKVQNMRFMLFLGLVFLSVRYVDDYSNFYLWLYQLPGFNLFRSPDKIFTLLPLAFCLFIVPIINKYKYIGIIVVGLSLIPWFTRDIFTINEKSDDQYKMLVQIPQEYEEIAGEINKSHRTTAIISLPYSVVNSINWSQYPKWNFIGHDILHLLYNKRYVSANSYDHPSYETVLSRRDINQNKSSERELIGNINKFGGEYVFYHKDIDPYWSSESQYLYSLLENSELLTIIDDNDYFKLYKVRDAFISPLLFGDSEGIVFDKINPTKYSLNLTIPAASTGEELSFLQSYHSEWKLYPGRPIQTGDCSSIQYYSGSTSQTDSRRDTSAAVTSTGVDGQQIRILTHVTTSGELLADILSGYQVDMQTLYQYNSLINSITLPANTILRIPLPQASTMSGDGVDSLTWGPTSECVSDDYIFFAGEELSYLWRETLRDDAHEMIYDYANGWTIDFDRQAQGRSESYLDQGLHEGRIIRNSDGSYDVLLTLYFRPQSWFYLGLLISGTTLLGLIGWLLGDYRNNKKLPD